jgi:exodeoxyribonuclease-3
MENPHGFLSEERDGFEALLDTGLVDVFRELNPDLEGAYTWWTPKAERSENRGRRLDYFLVSDCLLPQVKSCVIRSDVSGSDHAPLELVIDT